MKRNLIYKYVDDLWQDSTAQNLDGNEVDLFIYRSNLLGKDLRITNFGGGNTSCKVMSINPLTDEVEEVMWIKGSGGDIGTLTLKGTASLFTKKLTNLKNIYKGLAYEDEMVPLLNHCLFDLNSASPSIDTPLHGFLPFKHIDHLHPDAIIAIASAIDGEKITQQIYGDAIGWKNWQRPGFDLGLKLKAYLLDHPHIKGVILQNHGLFTWGETSRECYYNSLDVIEAASQFIASNIEKSKAVFGGKRLESLPLAKRRAIAANISPILRGLCSSNQAMIGHFNDEERVLEFVNSNDLLTLAPMGTSCPDHFLRTKIKPLVIDLPPDIDTLDHHDIRQIFEPLFAKYREEYTNYYHQHKRTNSPAIRDPNPVILLIPGLGMFSFAKDKQTARVAAEYYVNAINVMRGSEAISKYTALPHQEAFDIEYWLLEEAKLQRMPKEKALGRKIAFVTGASGGIGKAISEKLIAEGACVILSDKSPTIEQETQSIYSSDVAYGITCDVTNENSLKEAFEKSILLYGGIDIVVHSAGLAISKSLETTTEQDWDLLQDVLVKGQFLLAKQSVSILKKQNLEGDFITIASKNGIVAGANNIAYGSAKAAQQHMSRLLAVELASVGIRVNNVNPDGVIVGSKIWEGEWAEGRAKAYGIKVSELPQYYAQRNLLKSIILPQDIADGVFALLTLKKSTGNSLNIDGGIAAAFLR